ncbi:MAG TPA: GYD domain-containing protein [Propionibacteriaceae bacterium]|jgi:uncharacterized protein with GYD domain
MSTYLFQVSYTAEGAKGLLREGGTSRVAFLSNLAKSLGGKLEAYYFAFGEADAYVIVDGIDNVGAAALSLEFSASGAMRIKTTVLLKPEEIDAATNQAVGFRPPGA